MKAKLIFNLPEDKEDFEIAQMAPKMLMALSDVGNEVFRPARKHGYNNQNIRELVEHLDSISENKATELIGLLEEEFYRILQEHQISERI